MKYCPYCFIPLKVEETKNCPNCKREFSQRIIECLSNNLNLSLIGPRKAGKTTYMSVLFYLIENFLSQNNNITYSFLEEEGFDYILKNINKLQQGNLPSATGLNTDIPLIVLFEDFFFSKILVSVLDTPGELVEKVDYFLSLDLAMKVFRSQNIFLFIDVEEFFEKETYNILYTGFVSRYLNIKKEKNMKTPQNIYLIFTKSDIVFNRLYKYDFFNDYLNFSRKINISINDFRNTWEQLDKFSKEMKIVAGDKRRNFINLLEKNFNNVECFFVSALGEKGHFNVQSSFGVMNPLIHLLGSKYYNAFHRKIFQILKKSIQEGAKILEGMRNGKI